MGFPDRIGATQILTELNGIILLMISPIPVAFQLCVCVFHCFRFGTFPKGKVRQRHLSPATKLTNQSLKLSL